MPFSHISRPTEDTRTADSRNGVLTVDAVGRKPLKIACIGSRGIPSNYSGIEKVCEGLYSELAERGHEITVYCRGEKGIRSPETYRGIRLRGAPAIKTKALETISHAGSSFFHALVQGHYDVIHVHALASCIFTRVCRQLAVPTVATVHGLDWQRAKWKGLGTKVLKFSERSMVRNADRIIVVSRDLQSYYHREYGRNTIYIPNGVEPTVPLYCASPETLERFGLKSREYVLYLGRLVPEKRIEDLIVAYRGAAVDCRLVIAGGAGFTDDYVTTLRALAVGNSNIIFTGPQNDAAVQSLLHHAAAFISPSSLEGMPMSVLECMQHGTPAVLSDIPPHRELLGGIRGYDLFFSPTDVDALRTKIQQVLGATEHYRRVAEGAQLFVKAMHSWAKIAASTEDVLYDAFHKRITEQL